MTAIERWLLRCGLAFCAGLLATGVCLADDPLSWLARMETALGTRNYEGVFVHEHAGQTETLQVIHRSVGGLPAERLVSMDGSGREFIRRGNDLLTYLPDQRAVLVERGTDRSLVLGSLPRMDASLIDRYDVREVASRRLLGRDTRIVAIVPKDRYRYGYQLWIDEATAMPLKTQLRDAGDVVVEQIIFTSLKLPAQVADASLEPAVDVRGFRWLRYQSGAGIDSALAADWQAEQLPPGFRMTARATQQMPGSSGPVAHLVFSDGLASVSVFVEARSDVPVSVSSDVTRVGSSSAYVTVVDGHRVTVIGEVPPETVRAIAGALHSGNAGGVLSASAAADARNGGSKPQAPGGSARGNAVADPFIRGSVPDLFGVPSFGYGLAPRGAEAGSGSGGLGSPGGAGGGFGAPGSFGGASGNGSGGGPGAGQGGGSGAQGGAQGGGPGGPPGGGGRGGGGPH